MSARTTESSALGVLCALAAALVLGTGCAREVRRPMNLVVIGIDTLRADHLGCYGYGRPTSPRLDALATESVTFETAVSQAPWTLPAFASMFTGLLPSHHRAGEGTLPYVSRLDERHPTLAGILQAQGFRTAAFVSNVWVGRDVGLDRGFATHELHTTPQQALDGAVAWVSTQQADRFFLFVHLFDPHAPYAPPPEHAQPFVARDYTGPFQKAFPSVWRNGAPVMDVDPKWTAADRQRIVDLYDAEIHYVDALVGRLLDTLASRGVLDETLVAVTSDHGEEFFDHGDLDHGHTLYDELLHVPLIVRFPGGSRDLARVTAQVRTMDLFPTALETLGLAVPDGIDAESLLPVVRGDAQTPTAAVGLAEFVVHGPDPNAKALRLAGEKLIVAPTKVHLEYFDLAADPREQRNVAPEHADRVRSLRVELERHLLASIDGFHLFAVGQKEHRLAATIASDDGFADVSTLEGENGDRAEIAPDGRTLAIMLALRPQESPVRPHDLDGVRFRTRGTGPVRLKSLTLDGVPMPPMLQLGRSPVAIPPGPNEAIDRERLRVTHPARPRPRANGDVTVALQLVETPPRAAAELSPDVVERLRALGYAP